MHGLLAVHAVAVPASGSGGSVIVTVAVFDCCAWWRVAVIMRGTFRHGRHLGSGVDDCIDIALLPYGGLNCMLLLVALCVRSSDFITGFLPLDMAVRMAVLVSGAASKE